MRRVEATIRILAGLVLFAGTGFAMEPISAHGTVRLASVGSGGPGAPRLAAQEGIGAMQAEYVDSETCLTCHDGYEEPLGRTAHASPAFMEMGVHGCETCHGPGSLHMEDPENEELQPHPGKLSVEEQSAVCLTCHDGRNQFFWNGGPHESRDLSCLTCHSVHEPASPEGQLAKATQVETCLTCHKEVRSDLYKVSHHPIREGQISCADCHNPHGTQTDSLLRASTANEQCYTCHAEKRGPFLWEHPPVRENCLTCHTPHGSNHLRLQRTSVPYLCQQCHSNTRHPGTLYDARVLPGEPTTSNRAIDRACLNCHGAIHGSNHPSSPYLGH